VIDFSEERIIHKLSPEDWSEAEYWGSLNRIDTWYLKVRRLIFSRVSNETGAAAKSVRQEFTLAGFFSGRFIHEREKQWASWRFCPAKE
jgi:hypothetical protein